jgi:Peptidase family M1 domain
VNNVGVFNHENMHQWWGDNVAASLTRYTFLKEGMANLSERLATARGAATNAGGYGTAAGNAAFDASLVTSFNGTYNSAAAFWAEVPSNPTPNSLFDNPPTYSRPGAGYIALRQILGDTRWKALLHQIQHDFGGGNISEAQMEQRYHGALPNQSPACNAKLDQFFTQWWDTSYPSNGVAKPQITGPGLAGSGFYETAGPCSTQTPPVTTASFASGHLTLTPTDDGKGPGQTFYSLDGGPFQQYTAPVSVVGGGTHTVVFYSTDAQGNQEPNETYTFTLSVSGTGTVTGSVPATLMLTLGAPATFGPFTPGVTRDYSAFTTATVVSTAGNAALSVADPDTAHPGHLVNGAFVMPSALQASAASPLAGAGPAPASLGAAPLTLLNWTAPASNDPATVTFAQHVAGTDPLRTGTYSKTLTFTLSTTTP